MNLVPSASLKRASTADLGSLVYVPHADESSPRKGFGIVTSGGAPGSVSVFLFENYRAESFDEMVIVDFGKDYFIHWSPKKAKRLAYPWEDAGVVQDTLCLLPSEDDPDDVRAYIALGTDNLNLVALELRSGKPSTITTNDAGLCIRSWKIGVTSEQLSEPVWLCDFSETLSRRSLPRFSG